MIFGNKDLYENYLSIHNNILKNFKELKKKNYQK